MQCCSKNRIFTNITGIDINVIMFKVSQTEFGERLGVSRDVIKNIELNLLARPEQKISLFKLICREFSVSEEWLLNGTQVKCLQPKKPNTEHSLTGS